MEVIYEQQSFCCAHRFSARCHGGRHGRGTVCRIGDIQDFFLYAARLSFPRYPDDAVPFVGSQTRVSVFRGVRRHVAALRALYRKSLFRHAVDFHSSPAVRRAVRLRRI